MTVLAIALIVPLACLALALIAARLRARAVSWRARIERAAAAREYERRQLLLAMARLKRQRGIVPAVPDDIQ